MLLSEAAALALEKKTILSEKVMWSKAKGVLSETITLLEP